MSREKFIKAYSNLIEDERNEIIVIINGKPYTWNRAYDEIKNDTPLGKQILRELLKMEIIK